MKVLYVFLGTRLTSNHVFHMGTRILMSMSVAFRKAFKIASQSKIQSKPPRTPRSPRDCINFSDAISGGFLAVLGVLGGSVLKCPRMPGFARFFDDFFLLSLGNVPEVPTFSRFGLLLLGQLRLGALRARVIESEK